MNIATVNPIFDMLEDEVKKADMQLETLNEAVESFVKLNGAGDGVRKIIRTRLKQSKVIQELSKKKKVR